MYKTWLPLVGIALVSAALFTLSALQHGWMNEYYSAAALSGTTSWQSLLFVSFDSGNFMSIDKPPLGIWFSSLSMFVFGLSPLSAALPHILAGVATVIAVYHIVKQVSRLRVALLAAALVLINPLAVVLFGYTQPDSFLVLWMVLSLYTLYQFLTSARLVWAILTAVLLGLGFMTKSLQIMPLVLVYAVAVFWYLRPREWLKPVLISAPIFLVIALWWPVAVALTSPHERPYIGSTSDNSIWSLIGGYNGIGRLTTTAPDPTLASVVNGPQFGYQPGVLRLYNQDFGPNSAWLLVSVLPAVVGLLHNLTRRLNGERLVVALSLGWFLSYAVLISAMGGIVHAYYAVVLVVPLAVLTTISLRWMLNWYSTRQPRVRFILPLVLFLYSWTAAYLIGISETFAADYALYGALAGLGVACALMFAQYRAYVISPIGLLVVSLGLIGMGPTLYSIHALTHQQSGPFPAAQATSRSVQPPKAELITYLELHHTQETWYVATESTGLAAQYQLITGKPAMALGGFNGTDPALTVQTLEEKARQGTVRFVAISRYAVLQGPNEALLSWIITQHPVVYEDESIRLYDLRAQGI